MIVNQAWVAWKFRSRLMRHLRATGWRVVLVTDTTDSHVGNDAFVDVCDAVIHVPLTATRVNPLADIATFFGYVGALRLARPQVVLNFTIKPNIYGSLACRVLGIPAINNVTGLGTVQRSGALVTAVVRLLYRWAFRRASWIFFQNPDDARSMVAQGLIPSGRWSVLPGSGVDTARYRPMAPRRAPPGLRFCMLSRLLRDKGVVEFAEAARRVRAVHPDARFELWGILDEVDPRCVPRALIEQWESEHLLTFHGEARDALEAFADVDVVVLPSYYPEGVPRTLLEASSMALPTITTDTPGCREAVLHGQTGLLCTPRSVESLVGAMLRLLTVDRSALHAMGAAARRMVLQRFDEQIVLDQYTLGLASVERSVAGGAGT